MPEPAALTIVTACSRPRNLNLIANTIARQVPRNLTVNWLIVSDGRAVEAGSVPLPAVGELNVRHERFIAPEDAPRDGGQVIKNRGIALIDDPLSFVYFLDDDTTLHPGFYRELATCASADIILGEQVVNPGERPPKMRKAEPVCGQIDQGQYVVRRAVIGDDRIPLVYEGDGLFIEALVKKTENVVKCGVMSHYNFLRPAQPRRRRK